MLTNENLQQEKSLDISNTDTFCCNVAYSVIIGLNDMIFSQQIERDVLKREIFPKISYKKDNKSDVK
jgi:hypothetical protein